ncbi:MAG TPA: hypothetical protein VLH85_07215 [Levilinea sp.]|nr:hypothetical protein [Levilinea sp.]
MATSEERLKILRMIQEGKITAEEGILLMAALDKGKPPASGIPPIVAQPVSRNPRYLHVRVTDTDTGKVRVNIRLPISVINAGIKMGARFSPEIEGLDIDQLMDYIHSGETGEILDVFDEKDGEHVEVFIE